jgi:hypothetical protein
MKRLLACCCIFFALTITASAQEWEFLGEFNPNAYRILTIFPDTIDDKLYIGGNFASVDDAVGRNIAMFDGAQFHSMTEGINACWNYGCRGVASIIRYKGEIVASLVRSATSEAVPQVIGIGRWDGTQWLPLEGGISNFYDTLYNEYDPGSIYGVALDGDTLYCAGYFAYVDSVPATGLAAWDGTSWRIFGVEEILSDDDYMLATSVAKYKGSVYIGGNFWVTIDGQEYRDIARHDGTAWRPVGNGLAFGESNVHDMAVFKDKLYIGGFFEGEQGYSITSWDGEHWDDLNGGVCTFGGAVDGFFVTKDKLYVVGYFECIGGIEASNVATWDGTRWCSVGYSDFDRPLHAVALWRDTIYVGGSFLAIDGQPGRFLARYVGDYSGEVCSEPVSNVLGEVVSSSSARLLVNPNPAQRSIVAFAGHGEAPQGLRFYISNALGKILWSSPTTTTGSVEVSVESWPSGLYYVQAISEIGITTASFFKL